MITRLLVTLAILLGTGAMGTVKQGSSVTVSLKNGFSFSGQIVAETASGFIIKGPQSTQTIRYEDIEDIQETGKPEAVRPEPGRSPLREAAPTPPPPPPPPPRDMPTVPVRRVEEESVRSDPPSVAAMATRLHIVAKRRSDRYTVGLDNGQFCTTPCLLEVPRFKEMTFNATGSGGLTGVIRTSGPEETLRVAHGGAAVAGLILASVGGGAASIGGLLLTVSLAAGLLLAVSGLVVAIVGLIIYAASDKPSFEMTSGPPGYSSLDSTREGLWRSAAR